MTLEVLNRKKESLIKYLDDLKKYEEHSYQQFLEDHYSVERILELIIMVSSDVVFHLISEKGKDIPSSYRSAFLKAGELSIISNDLSERLALAAGMRNILVHDYLGIDMDTVWDTATVDLEEIKIALQIMLKEMEE